MSAEKILQHPNAPEVEVIENANLKKKKKKKAFEYSGINKYTKLNLKFYLEQVIHLVEHNTYTYEKRTGEDTYETVTGSISRETLHHALVTDEEHEAKEHIKYTGYNKIFKVVIKDIIAELRKIVEANKEEAYVLVILHDRDKVTDGIWEYANIKGHFHMVYMRKKDTGRIKGSTLLNKLGIKFDLKQKKGTDEPPLDVELVLGGAIDEVRSYEASVVYLTHETTRAKADHKEIYDRQDIIHNLTDEELEVIYQTYELTKLMPLDDYDEELILERKAIESAKTYITFDEWFDVQAQLPLKTKLNEKLRRYLKRRFDSAQDEHLNSEDNVISKVNIFLKGPGTIGKSFMSRMIMLDRYRRGKNTVLEITDGKTGTYDKVKSHHKALLIDDTAVGGFLNITDDKATRPYKRGSAGNPIFAGDMITITYNKEILEYLRDCKFTSVKTGTDENGNISVMPFEWQDEQIKAAVTRVSCVDVVKDYIRNDKGEIMIEDFSYTVEQDKYGVYQAVVTGKVYSYYQAKIERYTTRGDDDVVDYKKAVVDDFVKKFNALSIRRAKNVTCEDLSINHPLLRGLVVGSKVMLHHAKFDTKSMHSFKHYVENHHKIDPDFYNWVQKTAKKGMKKQK